MVMKEWISMAFPWISPISCTRFHRVVEGVFHFVANPRVSLSLFHIGFQHHLISNGHSLISHVGAHFAQAA